MQPMHTGPIDLTRGLPVYTQPPRRSNTPIRSSLSGAPYPSSQHSGKSPKKEPVHLPYTSANPDFAELPPHHGAVYRPDTSYTPRYHGRNRLRGFSMAAYYSGSDLHIFPSIRTSRMQRHQQMLPQISVVPAPKHNRMQQKRRIEQGQYTPQPVSVKRVEVSLHEVQQRTKPTIDVSPVPSHEDVENYPTVPRLDVKNPTGAFKDTVNLALKSVDLNKGLNAAAAIKRRTRESAKDRVATLEESLATKGDVHVMPLSHLSLKEVYLKPDPTSSREQASRQQQDKTIRILKWLKELKYLDEKTVQRGRSEVERTHFQLPEIKETSLTAYT